MSTFLVDGHLHIWSSDPDRYPWQPISGATPPTVEGSAEWLMKLMQRHGIQVAVAVQSRVYGYDHRYLADSLTRYGNRIVGVGMIDIGQPIPEQLASLEHMGIRGLRVDILGGSGELDRLTARELCDAAAKAGMPIELLVGSDQLEMVRPLLERAPGAPVIIEHMSLWGHRSTGGIIPLLQLGSLPHVFVKVTLADISMEGPPFRDLHSSVRQLRDAFGASRLIWGSDMPWRGAQTYQATLDAVAEHMPFLSPTELSWILGETARRVWAIEPNPS